MLTNYKYDMEKERFKKTFKLSESSIEKICNHINLLIKWQSKINLVSSGTLDNLWNRHIFDSAQIIRFLPSIKKDKIILDIGSGAGFPGLILSAMGREDIFLCDSNQKKCTFLKEAFRNMVLREKVFSCRVEELNLNNVSVLISRAFSSILNIFKSSFNIIREETFMILLKGKSIEKELHEAKEEFHFNYQKFPSITSTHGWVVIIKNIRKISNND